MITVLADCCALQYRTSHTWIADYCGLQFHSGYHSGYQGQHIPKSIARSCNLGPVRARNAGVF
eukprot:2358305-Rhodomonas_salina.1